MYVYPINCPTNKEKITCGGSNALTLHHITHWYYVLYESMPF